MLPAAVSIRMLACPVPVIRTVLLPRFRSTNGIEGTGSGLVRRAGSRRARLDPDLLPSRKDFGVSAEEEPVYSPDQLKPGNRKAARLGALGSAAVLLLFFWGNHEGNTENIFLVVFAAGLVAAVIADVILRRNGLKPDDQ
jgi:hypothetical protein